MHRLFLYLSLFCNKFTHKCHISFNAITFHSTNYKSLLEIYYIQPFVTLSLYPKCHKPKGNRNYLLRKLLYNRITTSLDITSHYIEEEPRETITLQSDMIRTRIKFKQISDKSVTPKTTTKNTRVFLQLKERGFWCFS